MLLISSTARQWRLQVPAAVPSSYSINIRLWANCSRSMPQYLHEACPSGAAIVAAGAADCLPLGQQSHPGFPPAPAAFEALETAKNRQMQNIGTRNLICFIPVTPNYMV